MSEKLTVEQQEALAILVYCKRVEEAADEFAQAAKADAEKSFKETCAAINACDKLRIPAATIDEILGYERRIS